MSKDYIVITDQNNSDTLLYIAPGTIYPSTIPSYYDITFQTEVMTKPPRSLDTQQQMLRTTTTTKGQYRKINKNYTPDTLQQATVIIDKLVNKYMCN